MTVQDDLEAALEWSTTRQLSNGQYDSGVGGRLTCSRLSFPRGGVVEFHRFMVSCFFFFEPAAGRIVYSFQTRKTRATSSATWLATGLEVNRGIDPGDENEWSGGVGFSPGFYPAALQMVGPCYIEDMNFADS